MDADRSLEIDQRVGACLQHDGQISVTRQLALFVAQQVEFPGQPFILVVKCTLPAFVGELHHLPVRYAEAAAEQGSLCCSAEMGCDVKGTGDFFAQTQQLCDRLQAYFVRRKSQLLPAFFSQAAAQGQGLFTAALQAQVVDDRSAVGKGDDCRLLRAAPVQRADAQMHSAERDGRFCPCDVGYAPSGSDAVGSAQSEVC